MTSTKNEALTLEVRKVISAPVERVYKAWIEPEQMQRWIGGDFVTSVRIVEDVRVGGVFEFHATKADGTTGLTTGVFKEIVPNKKLVFTWNNDHCEASAKDTVVNVEFVSMGDRTEVIIKHTNFEFQASQERHTMGWTGSLEKMEKIFCA